MVLFMRVAVINVLKDLVDVVFLQHFEVLIGCRYNQQNTEGQRPRICSCSEHLSFEYASVRFFKLFASAEANRERIAIVTSTNHIGSMPSHRVTNRFCCRTDYHANAILSLRYRFLFAYRVRTVP